MEKYNNITNRFKMKDNGNEIINDVKEDEDICKKE